MDWQLQLQQQNPILGELAKTAASQGFNPTLRSLDVGVNVITYSSNQPPQIHIEGANDYFVSEQEYLQCLISFIRGNPSQNAPLAKTLYDTFGIRLPFIVDDFNPNTLKDETQQARLKSKIGDLNNRPNSNILAQSNFYTLYFIASVLELKFDNRLSEQHTLNVWDVLAGEYSTCNGLENAYNAALAYAFGNQLHFKSYELFNKHGEWLGHGFAGVNLPGSEEIILDPTGFIRGEGLFFRSQLPEHLVTMPISELENLAIDLVTQIREDRKSAHPNLNPFQRKQMIDLAILLAPKSVFVLLELNTVYSEIKILSQDQRKKLKIELSDEDITTRCQDALARAEELYPGVTQRYLPN